MNVEAQSEEILKLLLAEGKEFSRMDQDLLARFARIVGMLLRENDLTDLAQFKSLHLKFFDGHYQINVDGEKRMWFELHEGEVLVTYFGSTDHKHGKKR